MRLNDIIRTKVFALVLTITALVAGQSTAWAAGIDSEKTANNRLMAA